MILGYHGWTIAVHGGLYSGWDHENGGRQGVGLFLAEKLLHHDQSEIGAPLNVNVEKSQTVLCQPPVHPFLTLQFLSWQKRSELVTGQFAKHLPSTVNGAPLEYTVNLSRSLARP